MKYLIDFKNTASDSDIANYLATNNCTVIAEWDNFDKIFLVEVSTEPPSTEIIERIVLDEPMKIKPLDVIPVNQHLWSHSDPNKEVLECSNTDTKDWWKVYSFTQPNFDAEATKFTRKGKGLDIYLMDSGILRTHPEFDNADIVNLYSIIDGNFNDHNGHGTALASVMVGKTCGITDATIKVVKIFDANHTTMQSEFLNALDAIAADHVTNTVSILNCSWVIDKNEWVEHKISLLTDMGIYVIAAAGNQGTPIQNVTPASMQQVITVGAYNQDLKPCDFSNYTGDSITSVTESATNHGALDGWAPGEQIWAAGLDNTYGYCAGTSIATAISSAIIANNIADAFDENGQLYEHYSSIKFQSDIYSGSSAFLFARNDILDLEDPKYSDSKNLIATIFDKATNPSGQQKDDVYGWAKVEKQSAVTKLYENTLTKSIEFIDPLPPNFKLLPDGAIWGAPTIEQGPVDGQNEVLYTIRYTRVNLDDTVDNCTLGIYVLGKGVEPESYPSDHPIGLKLQNFCGTAPSCQYYSTAQFGCGTTCFGNQFCCGNAKNNYNSCVCTSDRRLKKNIIRIGTHKLGIGLYRYEISGETQTGVMADELIKVKPEAVSIDARGYYQVNYCMID